MGRRRISLIWYWSDVLWTFPTTHNTQNLYTVFSHGCSSVCKGDIGYQVQADSAGEQTLKPDNCRPSHTQTMTFSIHLFHWRQNSFTCTSNHTNVLYAYNEHYTVQLSFHQMLSRKTTHSNRFHIVVWWLTRGYLWLAQLTANETLAHGSHDRTLIYKGADGRVNDTGFTPSVMIQWLNPAVRPSRTRQIPSERTLHPSSRFNN